MNAAERVGVVGLGQVAVPVSDVARAAVFYRDSVGLTPLFEASGMAFFDCGGVRLMLSRVEDPRMEPPGSVLYLRVEDIHAAHAEMAGRGVSFEAPPHLIASMPDHELWMAFFRDSEDNLLALMAEIR